MKPLKVAEANQNNAPDINRSTAELLKKYVEGIENYEADKQQITESLKEIYDEAKANGFDTKIIKMIIRLRKMDKTKLEEQEYLLETYKEALGMDK